MNKKKSFMKKKGSSLKYLSLIVLYFYSAINMYSQNRTVTGKVMDMDNEPIPGVTIANSNTGQGTISGNDGSYSISNVNKGAVLVFSFIGMKTQEIVITDQTKLDVVLENDLISLDEVVAVGYGTMRKSDLTGSVATIQSSQIESEAISSAAEALAGRVAGVQVSTNDGSPGGGVNVRIRGLNSINGSSNPLYVVDGIIGVSASTIDPAEIKDMQILKDASATAIYGSQGANGVIIITTNNAGKNQKSEITASYSHGMSKVSKSYDLLTAGEAYKLGYKIAPWGRNTKKFAEEYGDVVGVDWQDEIMELSSKDNVRISMGGNSGKTQYYMSGSLLDEKGIVKTTGYKRLNLKLTGRHEFSSKLNVSGNVDLTKQHHYGAGVNGMYGIYLHALRYDRHDAYRDIKTSDYMYDESGKPIKTKVNPLVHLNNIQNDRFRNDTRVSGAIEYKPFNWLTFKVNAAYTTDVRRNENFQGDKTINGSYYKGTASLDYRQQEGFSNDNLILINPKLKGGHRLNSTLGFTQQSGTYNRLRARSSSFTNDILGVWGLESGAEQAPSEVDKEDWDLHSFIGRLSYSFNDKLLFTGTFRADGSSKFGEGNQWGIFPSAGVGFRLSEVEYVKNLNIFSNLKLRASYGLNGNQGISAYSSLGKYRNENYTFDNQDQSIGVRLSSLPNPNLKWESTAQLDLGIEAGFFNNRLSFEAEYYHKKTSDLLYRVDLPYTSGLSSYLDNIGELENKGFEFSLFSSNVKKKNFEWTTNFNIAFNENKVLKLNGDKTYKILNSGWDYTEDEFLLKVGAPIGQMYGYVWEGVYQLEDFNFDELKNEYSLKGNVAQHAGKINPGTIKYKDITGDGIVDSKDKTVIGNGSPDFFGGLSNTFRYKNLKLNVHFTYQYGGEIYNMTRMQMECLDAPGSRFRTTLNHWSFENQDTKIPAPGLQHQGALRQVSSRYVEDASFVRLKTVSLNYSIPERMLKNIFLKSLDLSVSGSNLLTFSDYSGSNPEASTSGGSLTKGIDYASYPTARTYVFSLTTKF